MADGPAGDAWEDALEAPDRLLGGGSSLTARFDAWLADARVEDSADARARERWLQTAADADATFAGVLLDLAERGVGIAVATVGARRLQGLLQVIGADFIALRGPSGTEVLVALAAIASVRTAPAVGVATGERVVTTELRLADVLAELAAERARVRLVLLDGQDSVTGELRSVGQDVATLRIDGDVPATAYVRTAAVAEVILD